MLTSASRAQAQGRAGQTGGRDTRSPPPPARLRTRASSFSPPRWPERTGHTCRFPRPPAGLLLFTAQACQRLRVASSTSAHYWWSSASASPRTCSAEWLRCRLVTVDRSRRAAGAVVAPTTTRRSARVMTAEAWMLSSPMSRNACAAPKGTSTRRG